MIFNDFVNIELKMRVLTPTAEKIASFNSEQVETGNFLRFRENTLVSKFVYNAQISDF